MKRCTAVVLLGLGLLPAACVFSEPPPQRFAPLHYEYLTRLRLDVARIDIDDNWVPRGEDRHVEYLSPVPPTEALRQMAMDRLVGGGTANSALFSIEDASIIQLPDRYQATLVVRLDILDDAGNRLRGIEARVTDVHPVSGDARPEVRNDLYALTRQAMDDMNVEFEYQIRHQLNVQLQPTTPTAPVPPPVNSQDLGAPGSQPPPSAPPSGEGPATLPPPTNLAPPPPTLQPPPGMLQPPADQPPTDQPSMDQPPSDQPSMDQPPTD